MRLYLLRHARAVARAPGEDDRDRVLDPSGRADAASVGAHLRREGVRPALALVSPAARTRETWALSGLAEATPARFVDSVYEAEAGTLLGLVRSVEAGADGLILVGHNPGIEELALALVPGAARLASGLPTAALVTIDLATGTWRDAAPGRGRLVALVVPADLPAASAA